MADYKVLIAEDEVNISDFVSRGLTDFGYDVTAVSDGAAAWKLLQDSPAFDLIILDIRMPKMSGVEVCRLYRDNYGFSTPVIMLTALGTTDDIVMGLHAGADDYLVKPFKFKELVARIQAHLRRKKEMTSGQCLTCCDLMLDPSSHKAFYKDKSAELSIKEYRLLEYLIRHKGEILSRRQLLRDVWDKDFDTNTNIVDVYVRYLRNKIDDTFNIKLIHTIIGKGYMIQEEKQ